jgi:hypothetical protein
VKIRPPRNKSQRQLRPLRNRPPRIQLHRHIAPANQMHRFTGRAQRIRQIALRLLTGAENHMIHAQQLRLAADRDM